MLERVALDGEADIDPGFAVLVMLAGEAELRNGHPIRLAAGSTAVAPYAFGRLVLCGRGEILACRPPRPR